MLISTLLHIQQLRHYDVLPYLPCCTLLLLYSGQINDDGILAVLEAITFETAVGLTHQFNQQKPEIWSFAWFAHKNYSIISTTQADKSTC